MKKVLAILVLLLIASSGYSVTISEETVYVPDDNYEPYRDYYLGIGDGVTTGRYPLLIVAHGNNDCAYFYDTNATPNGQGIAYMNLLNTPNTLYFKDFADDTHNGGVGGEDIIIVFIQGHRIPDPDGASGDASLDYSWTSATSNWEYPDPYPTNPETEIAGPEESMDYLDAVLDDLDTVGNPAYGLVDWDRVYMTGHSGGAGMTSHVVKNKDCLAAAVIVNAAHLGDVIEISTSYNYKVILVNDMMDNTVSYGRSRMTFKQFLDAYPGAYSGFTPLENLHRTLDSSGVEYMLETISDDDVTGTPAYTLPDYWEIMMFSTYRYLSGTGSERYHKWPRDNTHGFNFVDDLWPEIEDCEF